MLNRIQYRSFAFIHDLIAIPLAWAGAYWLRYNLSEIPAEILSASFVHLIYIIPVQALFFYFFGLYRGIWRFASLPDLIRIIKSVTIGVTATMLVLFLINRLDTIPRSIPVFYLILLPTILAGSRLAYRWLKDTNSVNFDGKRALIVGAGRAGLMLARDMINNPASGYVPVAFVDDDPRLQGRELHGIKVVAVTEDLTNIVGQLQIELIVIAIASASSKQIQRIVERCEETGVAFRIVPPIKDLIAGKVTVSTLKPVSINDLLGRDPVELDWESIKQKLAHKTILVSGAGGSIGSELCRQVSTLNPLKLILLDHGEFNLYSIEKELTDNISGLHLAKYLGDITDRPFIEQVFSVEKPHIVFHAAAYKHVPMLENQLRQAMRNNIIGTQIMADAASRHHAETFVMVSTDKAVNPANIMGATKRAAEIYCQNLNTQTKTNFITVRFGNVLGSAGSVIPLFEKQIQAGGPLTVTDDKMERFFMTIPEACQLIMQTTVLGQGGEIFVLDMGEPVKIMHLAKQMIKLSGKVPGEDIEIKIVGLRPGEKLYEELFHEQEKLKHTSHQKVLLAQHREVDFAKLTDTLKAIDQACHEIDEPTLLILLNELVPERQQLF
jgi:FlaA1/EpsC-like NDP-sugar epimerase